jgi:hypothetical protein
MTAGKIIAILLASASVAFGKDVYVSSSSGNDSNDGSIAAPFKTLAAAPKKGVNLYLKRGDVFFETLSGVANSTVDAYGEGAKPLVCGLKILKNNDAWVKMPNDIWCLDLSKQEDFEGYKAEEKTNNIGAIYYLNEDKIFGHLVRRANAISEYGDFWVADSIETVDVQNKNNNFKYLYFKSKEHPSKHGKKIGFVTYSFGVREIRDSAVKNIAVKGFGVHGVSKAWNSKFQNLDIDLIGGSVQLSYHTWVRLGNGVEFWIDDKNPCNNNTVEGCKISRTYDCGSTIQGISGGTMKAENIKFTKNSFFRCRQAFEHFLRSNNSVASYKNCEFSFNKSFDMGENEYSTPEIRDANLLSYEGKPISGLVVKNNIFWGANIYSAQTYTAKLENNTFYVYAGQYLYFNRKKPQDAIWANSEADIAKFKSLIGDPSDKILIVSRDDKRLRQEVLDEAFAEQKDAIIKKTREKYRRDFFFRK